ncbi:hypothetical protein DY000_02050077 [Brassica cretica]|uniref:Uncharacterized protein n=1 Tax=Brassica cretica TaxID=69181 RepID=A0ABQ7EQ97_BRACR|nr:hypothetical protein DY000_02050077 [Brassica cretica]
MPQSTLGYVNFNKQSHREGHRARDHPDCTTTSLLAVSENRKTASFTPSHCCIDDQDTTTINTQEQAPKKLSANQMVINGKEIDFEELKMQAYQASILKISSQELVIFCLGDAIVWRCTLRFVKEDIFVIK